METWGVPKDSDGKESACKVSDPGSVPGSGRSPGEGNGNRTPVFLPGESYEQRSLMGYSPWGCKESDMTEDYNNNNKVWLSRFVIT